MGKTRAEEMRIDVQSMRCLVALAQEGSMSRAANTLKVAQPTMSRQLGALEQSIGKQLYRRENGRIVLTSEGRQLLSYAKKIVELADRAAEDMSSEEAAVSGHVTVACAETSALEFVGQCIAALHEKYPLVIVDLMTGSPVEWLDRLDAGVVDFMIDVDGPSRAGYDKVKLPSEGNTWVAVMKAGDRLAKREFVEPRDLAGEWVFPPRLAEKRGQIQEWAGSYYDSFKIGTTFNLGTYLINAMVAGGVGYALTYRGLQEILCDERLVSIPVRPAIAFDQSVLVWRRDRNMRSACRAFLEVVKEKLDENQLS